ncbi:flagellar basal body rod protein FlgC [Candidatus Margulisiibacteriota bacterium]
MRKLISSAIVLIMLGSMALAVGPGLDNALEISTSALTAQKIKMNVIANNIANVDTTETADGGPYRKQKVLIQAREFLRGRGVRRQGIGGILGGVQVVSIVEDKETPLTKVYDPAHPNANKNGFVYYPNVNMTEELVDMTQSSGAFETNVIVFNATKQMMQTALELGR